VLDCRHGATNDPTLVDYDHGHNHYDHDPDHHHVGHDHVD
jgi:hypothetical protein